MYISESLTLSWVINVYLVSSLRLWVVLVSGGDHEAGIKRVSWSFMSAFELIHNNLRVGNTAHLFGGLLYISSSSNYCHCRPMPVAV